MAVNKNFVVKNGFEVNTSLILADADSQRVGIGSTQPEHRLDVRGGIGATDIYAVGFTTLTQDLQVGTSGSVFYVSDSSNTVGVGTSVPAYTLDVRGPVSTGTTALYVYGDAHITGDLVIDDFTLDELYVAGISTLVGFSTFEDYVFIQDGLNVGGGVTAASLDISGVSTFTGNVDINSFTDISGNVNIGGITTIGGAVDINSFTDISGNVNIGGITTVANYVLIQSGLDVAGVGATTTTLNVSGVSTFGSNVDVNSFVDVSGDLNVGGLSTFVGVGTFQNDLFVDGDLNVTGSLVYADATASNINITGIATVGTLLDVNGDVDISNNLNVDSKR